MSQRISTKDSRLNNEYKIFYSLVFRCTTAVLSYLIPAREYRWFFSSKNANLVRSTNRNPMRQIKPPSIQDSLKPIVALCKRRGFIYPGSEIYGGFANTYSFGPYGAELKKNVKDLWWRTFVQKRRDMVGLDGPILLHPKAWAASGHLEGF